MSSPGDAETIPALLALRRRTAPDHPALVTEDAAVTYLDLDDASADLALSVFALATGSLFLLAIPTTPRVAATN